MHQQGRATWRIRSRNGVSDCSQCRQAATSSPPKRAVIPRRNRRASPPSARQAGSHARNSSSLAKIDQSRSRSAIWPAASMTNACSPPSPASRMPWTRPWLPLPCRILAELNLAPTASAATACPASCQAVRTAAARAGA